MCNVIWRCFYRVQSSNTVVFFIVFKVTNEVTAIVTLPYIVLIKSIQRRKTHFYTSDINEQ